MKAYFFVFILTLIICWAYKAENEAQYKKKLFVMLIPLFLFGALRVDFGLDYPDYEDAFNSMHYGALLIDLEAHQEIGFQVLCYVLPTYRSLLVLNAFLLCLAIGIFFYNNVPNKYLWIAVLLMFLNPEKNIYGELVGVRTGLVVSGFLIGFVLIQKRKLIPFALLIVGLSLFHTSVLLFLPIAYVMGRNTMITRKEIIVLCVASVSLLIIGVSGLIDIVSPFISNYMERYETYLEGMVEHRGILIVCTNIVFIIAIFISFYSRKDELAGKENSLYRMGILYLMTAFLGSLSTRASYFYDMFFIATVVSVFTNDKSKPILRYGLVILALLVSYYSTFIVWMGSQFWCHETYHSLIGSW